jgi:hypothetical protein
MSTERFEDITAGRTVLGAHANADGVTWFTKRKGWLFAVPSLPKPRKPRGKPGSGMVGTATGLLFLLGAGLLGVSLAAQYRYLMQERHQHVPSLIEALALDLGMLIFSLLALGLARAGKPAKAERLLIIGCAAGSAVMNYAASDVTSPRSVLAYTMPPIFLAIVADRVISVVRRHYLGETEASAWQAAGRASAQSARFAGRVVLYGLRLALAPRSTLAGGRRAVLLATPLPAASAPLASEPPRPELRICAKCQLLIARGEDGTWWSSWDADRARPCDHEPFRHVGDDHEDERDDEEQDGDGQSWRPPRPGTKTARFQAAVIRGYGELAGIPLEQVSPIASALAPAVDLNVGTARSWLRRAVLAAQDAGAAR